VPKRLVEVEVPAELFGQEGMEVPPHGSSGQEVRPRGLELAGTGAAEDEPQAAVLDVTVDLVPQRREALHLVHDDQRPRRQAAQLARECAGVRKVGLVERLVEQVDPVGPREDATEPGALAHAARPEEKERPLGRGHDPRVEHVAQLVVILSEQTTACKHGGSRGPASGRPPAELASPSDESTVSTNASTVWSSRRASCTWAHVSGPGPSRWYVYRFRLRYRCVRVWPGPCHRQARDTGGVETTCREI